ncbi:MAG TPA: tetratricopeptide repeat protein [Blastocatellia bacterium]|nr:tetratricopeptide repeat protein [Blastocatellia bacterium]
MNAERWEQINRLWDEALGVEPDERAAFLDKACAGDEALRLEVESLLDAHQRAGSFIEALPFEVAADLLARQQSQSILGRSIGPYRVVSRIGRGGMGEVYLARDARLGRPVALKLLPPDFTTDKDRVRRFEQEARAASALNHPNILTVYDVGRVDGSHFIVTEFVEGDTLRQRLAAGKMNAREALEAATQVTGALAAAHQAGIVHRDIKPENIILRPDGYVKVLDFGIAKLTTPRALPTDTEMPTAAQVSTDTGRPVGTVSYMSPEQARGLSVDARTDIFSLGIVLYEMLAGRRPFEGETAGHVMVSILEKTPTPLKQHCPEVPDELQRIVTKALAKDRHQRYQAIQDLRTDLARLKETLEFQARLEQSVQPVLMGEAVVRTGSGQEAGASREDHPPLTAGGRPLRNLDGRPNNLPAQPTALIGRKTELAEVEMLLLREDVRLVTMTGPGGTGKTCLGVRAAAHLIDQFEGGICFVSLAPIRKPALVASAIIGALGGREAGGKPLIDSLKEHLRDKQILLLLDNFEQVVPAAPLVAELLSACPRLKVLVTSRMALRLRGEQEFAVPPLALPDPKHLPSLEMLSRNAAVVLFVQRARAVRRDFVMTDEGAAAIAQICIRLDGLPLAIELAAARIKVLSPQAILERLRSRLKLLTGGAQDMPPRQQTMRKAIAWSYDLLDEAEKRLFRRLAVFVAGFTLRAAEAVCDGAGGQELDVLDGVSSLVNKSLLRQGEQARDGLRFMMLETIREYGLERLAEGGEAEEARRAHAAYYLSMVEDAEPELRGPGQAEWLERLESEHDNLRAALRWSKESGETEMALRMAAAPRRFWEIRGHLSEGRGWLEEMLTLADSERASPALLAKAFYAAGALARCQGDYDQTVAHLERALALYRRVQDRLGIASSLNSLGMLAHDQNDYGKAMALLEEGLALHKEVGDEQGIAISLEYFGIVALDQGNYEQSVAFQEESVSIRRKLKDKLGIATSLNNLGVVALDYADYKRATPLFEESLALFCEIGDKLGIASSLNNLGEIAQCQGDYDRAAAFYTDSMTLFREVGDKRDIATLLSNLGDIARYRADYRKAAALYAESLTLRQEVGEKWNIAFCFEGMAYVALALNKPEQAARLLGAAEALREAVGAHMPPSRQADYEHNITAARAALGEADFKAAWSQGRSMGLEELTACASEILLFTNS